MAKKKVQYPNRKKKIIRNSVIALCAAAVAGGAVGGTLWWRQAQTAWVMKLDGVKISAEELRYFAEDVAFGYSSESGDYKADGYEAMTRYYVMEKAAAELGYARTQEDLDTAAASAVEFKDYLESMSAPVPKLSDAKWAELLSAGSVDTPLYEHYTADYTVNEEEFTAAFEDYFTNQKAKWVEAEMKYVYNTDKEQIDAALAQLEGGGAFDDAVTQYSANYTEGSAVPTIELKQLTLEQSASDEILALEAGQRTGILNLGTEESPEYVIFEIVSMNVPEKEDLKTTYRESYENEGKLKMFDEKITELQQKYTFEKNEKGYDALTLF